MFMRAMMRRTRIFIQTDPRSLAPDVISHCEWLACSLRCRVPLVHENSTRSAKKVAGDDARIPILFVIGTLDIGGAETQLVEMVRDLDPRFAPAVCCLASAGPLAQRLADAGVPVTTIGLRGL